MKKVAIVTGSDPCARMAAAVALTTAGIAVETERRVGKVEELGMPFGVGPMDDTTIDFETNSGVPLPFQQYETRGGSLADQVFEMDEQRAQARRAERADDLLPDRASIERNSPYCESNVANLGVRIDGIEQDSVVEYCVSEGWARIGERDARGNLIWEFDHYRSRRVENVKVEPYWKVALSRQARRATEARRKKLAKPGAFR